MDSWFFERLINKKKEIQSLFHYTFIQINKNLQIFFKKENYQKNLIFYEYRKHMLNNI